MSLHLAIGALPCQCSVADSSVLATFTSNQFGLGLGDASEVELTSTCMAVFLTDVTSSDFGFGIS